MLSADRITELAQGAKVRRVAVENFLSSLEGLTGQEALGNLELDAASYRWNGETRSAIHQGIMENFWKKK